MGWVTLLEKDPRIEMARAQAPAEVTVVTVVENCINYNLHWLMTPSTHLLRRAVVEADPLEEGLYISMSVICSESKEMSAQMGLGRILGVSIDKRCKNLKKCSMCCSAMFYVLFI